MLELTQWKLELKIFKRVLIVQTEKLGIDLSDTISELGSGTQAMESK